MSVGRFVFALGITGMIEASITWGPGSMSLGYHLIRSHAARACGLPMTLDFGAQSRIGTAALTSLLSAPDLATDVGL
jgi:hypothetical protein